MDAAIVVAMLAIPLLMLQLFRGKIRVRGGGTIYRDTSPILFWISASIMAGALLFLLVMIAFYNK